jgi:hypothetical protein
VHQIYAIREAHAAEFGYDLKAMFEDARRKRVLEKHRRIESLQKSEQQSEARIASVMDFPSLRSSCCVTFWYDKLPLGGFDSVSGSLPCQ